MSRQIFAHLKGARRVGAFLTLGAGAGGLLGIASALLFLIYRQHGTLDDLSYWRVHYAVQFSSTADQKLAFLLGAGVILLTLGASIAAASVRPASTYGAARFAARPEIAREGYVGALRKGRARDSDVIWGKFGRPAQRGAYFKTSAFPHGIFIAPTGAGKGVGFVIPNLLHFEGSILCLDVKGENFEKTSRHRKATGNQVIHFAPLDPARSHCYNPLAEIEALDDADRQYVELGKLASAFMSGNDRIAGWIEGAKKLFAATAMLAIERGDATMAGVWDMLQGATPEACGAFMAEVQYPAAKKQLNAFAVATHERLNDYNNILSDFGLGAWGNPYVRRTTSRSDFSLRNLRRERITIYVNVPEGDLSIVAPLVRMFFQQLSGILHATTPGQDEPYPVLFILDEFQKLGRMDTLVDAFDTIRSKGGRLVVICQAITRLFDIYGRDGTRAFIANAGIQMYGATNDLEAAELISDVIGDRTLTTKSHSRNVGAGAGMLGGNRSQSTREEGLRLVKPQDVTMMDPNRFIIMRKGLSPVWVDAIRYYEDRHFAPIAESQAGSLPYPEKAAPADRTAFEPPAAQPPHAGAAGPAPADPAEERQRMLVAAQKTEIVYDAMDGEDYA